MQDETTVSGILGGLQRFQTSMEATIDAIPHLQPTAVRFGEVLSFTQDLVTRQAAAIAEKQDLSRQIPPALSDALRLATVLRKGLQQHFGARSEKLAEFGLKPFRGRKRRGTPEPEEPTPQPAETPAPSAE